MTEKHEQDLELCRRVLAGDRQAFDSFFQSYFARVYRFVFTRVDQDVETAKEVVHLTMSRAVNKLDSYRGEASLFTWLCQICRNELAGFFRREARQTRGIVYIDADPEILAMLESLEAPESSDPFVATRRAEVSELVQTVLDYLPTKYGDALEWKYIYGHSVKEIAQRLGIGEEAAQSLLARARNAFRDGFKSIAQKKPEFILE